MLSHLNSTCMLKKTAILCKKKSFKCDITKKPLLTFSWHVVVYDSRWYFTVRISVQSSAVETVQICPNVACWTRRVTAVSHHAWLFGCVAMKKISGCRCNTSCGWNKTTQQADESEPDEDVSWSVSFTNREENKEQKGGGLIWMMMEDQRPSPIIHTQSQGHTQTHKIY